VPSGAIDAHAVLKVIAEPRRADIIRLLERRHRTQSGLCRDLGMSQPLLSHHLKALRDAGLIDTTLCEGIQVSQLRTDALHALSDRIATMISNAERVAEHRPC